MAQAQPRLDILAVGQSAIGSVYVGSAIAQQQQQDVWMETIIAVVCVVIALLGLWKSPLWLLAGYVLHGVWDLFHHAQSVGTQISQRWYPPLCVGFDWAILRRSGLAIALAEAGELTINEICEQVGCSRSTYYRQVAPKLTDLPA